MNRGLSIGIVQLEYTFVCLVFMYGEDRNNKNNFIDTLHTISGGRGGDGECQWGHLREVYV